MHCTHCGKPILDGANFCIGCGSRIQATPVQPQSLAPSTVEPEQQVQFPAPGSVEPEQQVQFPAPGSVEPDLPEQLPTQPSAPRHQKKGSLKAPLIMLSVLSVIGLILYFLFPMGENPEDPTLGQPGQTGADTPWFEIFYGSLYFYEDSYTGSMELTVPDTVNGKTVTSIGEFCFSECDSLTTVILPDTIESIEYQAFYNCDNLRGIYIPEGVTDIGEEAFADCDALEAVSLPASLETLDATVFDDCDKLKYVFFSGTRRQWTDLYEGKTNGLAFVYCSDGKLPLG